MIKGNLTECQDLLMGEINKTSMIRDTWKNKVKESNDNNKKDK